MSHLRKKLSDTINLAGEIILGKERQIRLSLACLLARGHLLIEDLPGVGKTTLAHTLAQLLGLQFSRIQFTSDLLPADIVGASIYDREQGNFHFLPGPIFAQVLLADEINRATPKTQSALLEAMEEHQVTAEGETRPLPAPFFVIATQNPSHQIGTFALPESQLDRFLMRIDIGYPDRDAERRLLSGGNTRERLTKLPATLSPIELQSLQAEAAKVIAAPALIDYVQTLVEKTRHDPAFIHGLSPRAALALLAAGRTWAFIEGRDMVLPEDIQTVFSSIAGHRLRLAQGSGHATSDDLIKLIERTPLP